MEPVSYKDKLKEEVSPEKRGDQRQLLSVSQPTPWWKCLFPIFCMNFFLLSGKNGTKKCYDPYITTTYNEREKGEKPR
jgi:hypothetical protein